VTMLSASRKEDVAVSNSWYDWEKVRQIADGELTVSSARVLGARLYPNRAASDDQSTVGTTRGIPTSITESDPADYVRFSKAFCPRSGCGELGVSAACAACDAATLAWPWGWSAFRSSARHPSTAAELFTFGLGARRSLGGSRSGSFAG